MKMVDYRYYVWVEMRQYSHWENRNGLESLPEDAFAELIKDFEPLGDGKYRNPKTYDEVRVCTKSLPDSEL